MVFFVETPTRMSTFFSPLRSLIALALFAPTLAMAQPADAGPDVLVCGDQYDMLGNTPAPPGVGLWNLISGWAVIAVYLNLCINI